MLEIHIPELVSFVIGRLAVVQQKLNQVGEATSQPEEEVDPDTTRRIADLHKYSEKAGSVLTEIPELIDRLEALSPLHAQVDFFNTIFIV